MLRWKGLSKGDRWRVADGIKEVEEIDALGGEHLSGGEAAMLTHMRATAR